MMATANQRVIKIPRTDNGFVLISVSSRGPKLLDLNLLGTENEAPYFASIVEDNLRESKAKTDDCTNEAWLAAISWVLLQQKPAAEYQKLIERVYVVASIQKQGLLLTFRQNIEGLTPRIGSINLAKDDDQELDLFEWAGLLAESSTNTEQRDAELLKKLDAQQSTINKLNAQLQDFIEAKKQQEDTMLERFRQLLNIKKLKIRDQQRLLASANVDPDAAEPGHEAHERHASSRGAENGSRGSKRKANGDVDAEMDDAEAMDAGTESEDDFEVAKTPQRSASEDSDAKEKTANNGDATTEKWLPPQRELPFLKKTSSTGPAVSKKVEMEREDDEETDDEL